MKFARLCFALLLALLLPLQGAMAAAMLCPHRMAGEQQQRMPEQVGEAMSADVAMADVSQPQAHRHDPAGQQAMGQQMMNSHSAGSPGSGFDSEDHHAADRLPAGHHATGDHAEGHQAERHDAGSHDAECHDAEKCGICAAWCSGAAMVSVWPTAYDFRSRGVETFSVAALPAASFLSGGQDRPPRSF